MGRVGDWLATVARAATIFVVAMIAALVYCAGSIRRLAIRDRVARSHHRRQQRGRLMRWAFAHLGATFVKVGQIMSSRPDLFSSEVIDELRWLQDRVPPFRFRRVRQIIERELGAPIDQHFKELSPAPIAAGSVAQVHRGVLVSGADIAVKVLRPGVIARVRRDGRIMLWLAHVAHMISARARTADTVGHVRSLVAGILAQTDLRLERNNYDRFRRNFGAAPGLHFPHVHRELSTRSMLTMELVQGARLDAADVAHLPRAAEVIRRAFFAMCFEHGFVHADLHPGNVLIRDDGVVVLLDVGLVKRLSRGLLEQVVDFTRCLAGGDSRDLVAHLRGFHHYLAGTDWDAVAADATAFIAKLRSQPIAALELSSVVGELFALARKHQIRPMPEMTLVLLGMVTNEGMAKRLDPNADMLAELARYLGPRMQTHPGDERKLARGSRSWTRSPIDGMRVTGTRAKVVIGRPPVPAHPARITARYLAARSHSRKDH